MSILAAEAHNPLIPPLGEIIIGIIAFAIVFVVFAKFVAPRFEQVFRARREAIEGGIERAEAMQVEARAALDQYRAQLAEARSEAAQIRDQARAEGQQILEELRAQAQEESARIVARGEEQLTSQRQQVVNELRGQIGALAVELAGRVVGRRGHPPPRHGRPLPRRAGRHGDVRREHPLMEASTRVALAQARERLQEIARGAAGPALLGLADELFAVARLLDGQLTLRRALSDPAGKPEERAGLARRLFSGKVSDAALDLVETMARQRWSRPIDLVDAAMTLAIEASLDAADARAELESVEDELFRFGRIVAGDRDLSRVLSDRTASAEGKAELLDRLLSGRVSPVTEQLLRNVLTGPHAGNAEATIDRLSDLASLRRGQSVARVTSAVELTAAQERRLAEVLGRIYGRTIGLQVIVDPDVVGGLVVQVGGEVIDGSIAHRLEVAGRRLVG
jgi:F-type H+-transporting ATPase subunit delta